MPQMYKVFIDEKLVVLTNELPNVFFPGETMVCDCKFMQFSDQTILTFAKNPQLKKLIIINTDGINLLLTQFNSVCNHITAGGGIVRSAEGSILFIYRRGKWDLPKGKPDKHERIENTALREVMEETGIKKLKINRFVGITRHVYIENESLLLKTSHWFEMQVVGTPVLAPQTDEGITEAKWVKINDLSSVLDGAYQSIRELVEEYLMKRNII